MGSLGQFYEMTAGSKGGMHRWKKNMNELYCNYCFVENDSHNYAK